MGEQLRLTVSTSEPVEPDEGKRLKAVGIFAGVGGIERGLEKAGHETILLCENDVAAKAVLEERFPDVEKVGDVKSLRSLPSETELVVAGFPCQDLSQAGKTVGLLDGERSSLIGEVLRLLKRKRVPWVVLENVPFMLQLNGGNAMHIIVNALEALKYRWAYRVVDTRSFGLPQRRRRVYLVAARHGDPRTVLFADVVEPRARPKDHAAYACGFYWTEGIRGLGWAVDAVPTLKGGSSVGIPSPPAVLLPTGSIVMPHIEDAERLQGFPARWTEPAAAVARDSFRWKLVGNAVSVPSARWIGQRLRSPGHVPALDVYPLSGKWPAAAWNVGKGRFGVKVSEWPSRHRRVSLARFLKREGRPLSIRATRGFLGRLDSGSLRLPTGFRDAVMRHLAHQLTIEARKTRAAGHQPHP